MDRATNISYNEGENPSIELFFMGDESIPVTVIETWRQQMKSYPYLENATLQIQGGRSDDAERYQYVTELYEAKKEEIANKEQRISILENEVERLRKFAYNEVPFEQISQEIRLQYEGVEEVGFANEIVTNFTKTDTIPVFYIKWSAKKSSKNQQDDMKKLLDWLKVRTGNANIKTGKLNISG